MNFPKFQTFHITIKPFTQRDLVLKLTYIAYISLKSLKTHQTNINRVKTISQTDLLKPRLLQLMSDIVTKAVKSKITRDGQEMIYT